METGIDSPEKLRQIGAKKAYEKMYPAGDAYGELKAAPCLFALEGAIRDCDWLEIPEEIMQEYIELAKGLQSK